MATGDVRIIGPGGHSNVPTFTALVEAAATTINPGEPVKRGGTGGNFAIPLADGEPEISADLLLGVSASTSDETASADGTVEVYVPLEGLIYQTDATTPGNLANGLLLDRVTFDLAAGVYTVDENEGDNADHGLAIIGFDSDEGTVDYIIRSATTLSGNNDV